ncbi:hypothetical protein F4805DRAFT_437099 [Annulohypoxylon moriforme]|nr:hypothetical protein F4805DRAFT_437099 [Annulohypoxylon moriforme]
MANQPTGHITEHRQLLEEQPEFNKFNHTAKIVAALDDVGVTHDIILNELENGISDFCIPMRKDHYPRQLSPSRGNNFEKKQKELLIDDFGVEPWSREHFNLAEESLRTSRIPLSLEYVKSITHGKGKGGRNTIIQVVQSPSSGNHYVLKRIKRNRDYDEELEEMKYIKGEISIMKRMRDV